VGTLSVPGELYGLVERFDENLDEYKSGRFGEAQTRVDFINPLLGLLGWDVENRSGRPEAYRDVIYEDEVKIGGYTKAPDYGFYVGGARKFFLEAKKPSVDLAGDVAPAVQLRRYAWSARLPLSILTDFEEFAVYDCRVEPEKGDSAATARLEFFTYDRYAEEAVWEKISSVFSREAVLAGSLEKYAEENRKRRGTQTVDAAFLREIESWRGDLARDIALRNNLNSRQLNFAVQMTIDRIVFLRMAEDRGVEEYGRLLGVTNGNGVPGRLLHLFREADDRYNSGLFHFRHERGREEEPDRLTPNLEIGDDVLRGIIRGLYYPDSPYEFSVLPVDVLGQVYEQFLGKVIRLDGHEAVVEEKPEVRKAGGVYYTPTYIVDYIVEKTVGKLLEGKRPGPRGGASRLKIVDPACGSGSFLIGAYQYLLDWHRDRYVEDGPESHPNRVYQGDGGQWHLTMDEKKRILLNNIYGVDIDSQAVEVTKLSLLLKVLEGESQYSLEAQLKIFQERALPDLDDNIKCGNSLIGPDFYDNEQMMLLDEEEHYRVNVFDWRAEFPQVFSGHAPGFDAVIGNPPYLNVDDTWGKGDVRQRYIKRTYAHVYNDKTDILFYFLAKAVQISKGKVGFIVSRAFLEAYKADKLRAWLAEHANIEEILDFRNYYVFEGVGITTAIVSLDKDGRDDDAVVFQLRAPELIPGNLADRKADESFFQTFSAEQRAFGASAWSFASSDAQGVIEKVDAVGDPLGDVLVVGQGMQTGRNNVFGKLNRSQIEEWRVPKEQHFVRARNSDLDRYSIRDSGEYLLYLEDVPHFGDLPEGVQGHLKIHEGELKARAAYQRGDCEWWRYTWPLHKGYLMQDKLYCPYLATHNRFALDEQQQYLGLTDTTVLYDAD
jgi:type I restriction-modification system DNA methylase subunit/predicted type IV restriction endonuclease